VLPSVGEVVFSKIVGSVVCDFTYTGQEWDADLGLMNYKARMYDPKTQRFLSPDPLNQYPSPYAYVGNNPISLVDPSGMGSEAPLKGKEAVIVPVVDPTAGGGAVNNALFNSLYNAAWGATYGGSVGQATGYGGKSSELNVLNAGSGSGTNKLTFVLDRYQITGKIEFVGFYGPFDKTGVFEGKGELYTIREYIRYFSSVVAVNLSDDLDNISKGIGAAGAANDVWSAYNVVWTKGVPSLLKEAKMLGKVNGGVTAGLALIEYFDGEANTHTVVNIGVGIGVAIIVAAPVSVPVTLGVLALGALYSYMGDHALNLNQKIDNIVDIRGVFYGQESKNRK